MWPLTQGSMNSHQCLHYYLPVLKMKESLPLFKLSLSLLHPSAHPLPSRCGLSDLAVNLCGCSELSLCYWKHPFNTPISYDVQMIGCAVFGYPFPIAGHDWSELPEMMSLLCDASKKTQKKSYEEEGRERKGRTKH